MTRRSRRALLGAGIGCGVIALLGGAFSEDRSASGVAAAEMAEECDRAYPDEVHNPLSVNVLTQDSDGCFKARVATLEAGSTRTLGIRYQNGSDALQEDVVVRVSLPPTMQLVPNSTDYLNGSTDGEWEQVDSNNLADGGVVLGSYEPGGALYVRFDVTVPFESDLECGTHDFRVVGVVQPDGLDEHYNTTQIALVRNC